MINESKLNNRMLHLMESHFFGKQLLNENFSENIKVRIFQTFYNYFEDTINWILVDGIPGKNTANAINTLMNDRKSHFTAGFTEKSLTSYYKMVLNTIKAKYLSNLKELNNIHYVRVLQAILHLCGRTEVIPDGVVGTKTKAAMREKLGTDNAAQIPDDKLNGIIDFAIKIVDATNMTFKIEGVEGATGAGGTGGGGTGGGTGAGETSDGNVYRKVTFTLDKGLGTIYKAWRNSDGSYQTAGTIYIGGDSGKTKEADFPSSATETYYYAVINEIKMEGTLSLAVDINGPFSYPDADTRKSTDKVKFKKITSNNISLDAVLKVHYPVNLFLTELNKVKGIVKNYSNKLGSFSVIGTGISFYGYNFLTNKKNYVYTTPAPTKKFKEIAKEKGFDTQGCWRYIPSTDRIYLFKCESVRRAQLHAYDIKGPKFFEPISYMY